MTYWKVTMAFIWGCSSPVIGHTHLQNRKGMPRIVEELFGTIEKKEDDGEEKRKEDE